MGIPEGEGKREYMQTNTWLAFTELVEGNGSWHGRKTRTHIYLISSQQAFSKAHWIEVAVKTYRQENNPQGSQVKEDGTYKGNPVT